MGTPLPRGYLRKRARLVRWPVPARRQVENAETAGKAPGLNFAAAHNDPRQELPVFIKKLERHSLGVGQG